MGRFKANFLPYGHAREELGVDPASFAKLVTGRYIICGISTE